MKVYLDACSVNRLTDDQSQPRIREEADAIESTLRRICAGELEWASSEALIEGINRNPRLERRLENSALPKLAKSFRRVAPGMCSIGGSRCLADNDDGFARKASRGDGRPRVLVTNPVSWSRGKSP